jgi:hypothetical protein
MNRERERERERERGKVQERFVLVKKHANYNNGI